MVSVFDVAKYFLSAQDIDAGDTISNMKLQKLVYYAQGFHLAINGEPLFVDEIKAWEHGPVVPALYHEYKDFTSRAIPIPSDVNFDAFSPDQKELLDDIQRVYGQYSAWKLRNMTHDETPWMEAKNTYSQLISKQSMKDFFSNLLIK